MSQKKNKHSSHKNHHKNSTNEMMEIDNSNSSAIIIPITSRSEEGQTLSPSRSDMQSPTKLIKVRPLQIEELSQDEDNNYDHHNYEKKQQKILTINQPIKNNSFPVKIEEKQKNQSFKTEHFVYDLDQSSQSEEMEQYEEDEEEQSEKDLQKITMKEKIFIADNLDDLIMSPVPPTCTLKCMIVFEENFFSLQRKYELYLVKQKKKILTAQRNRFQLKTHFQLNSSVDQNIGEIKANFTGTEFTVQLNKDSKEVCWIGYTSNFLGFAGERNLTVLRNANKKLQNVPNFSKIKTYYENGLSTKFEKFQNKKANKKDGKLEVDFHGKVVLPSNRNFILEGEKGKQSILFGKKQKGAYILQISHPFSILEAFGVAMSSLDQKILVR